MSRDTATRKTLEMTNDAPAPAEGEMLYGAGAIGIFLGVPRRAVYHLTQRLGLPAFKLGEIVCARPAALREWVAKMEAGGFDVSSLGH